MSSAYGIHEAGKSEINPFVGGLYSAFGVGSRPAMFGIVVEVVILRCTCNDRDIELVGFAVLKVCLEATDSKYRAQTLFLAEAC